MDDQESKRTLRVTLLQPEGDVVDCAASGLEALTAVRAYPPGLVLRDLMMPDMDVHTGRRSRGTRPPRPSRPSGSLRTTNEGPGCAVRPRLQSKVSPPA